MKFFLTILASLLITLSAGFSAGIESKPLKTDDSSVAYRAGELLVKFNPNVPQHVIDRLNQSNNVALINHLPFGIKHLRLPKGKSPEEMANLYNKNPNVAFAHPNHINYAFELPNDPYYSYQWNFENAEHGGIHVEGAWSQLPPADGVGVTVAVLDTGIAYENYGDYILVPDLANSYFVQGYDFINNDAHPNDDHYHGTHVAGTIAQSTNNGIGVAGIAYNASLMPVKVLNAEGSGSDVELVNGISYAIEHGADVINMSLGYSRFVRSIAGVDLALENAYANGIVIVAASGNNGYSNFVSYPARHPDVIAVGATDYSENVTWYSNKGVEVELSAPGGDTSQDPLNSGYASGGILQQTIAEGNPATDVYYFLQGTSMATPHVAAVAAMVKEANSGLSNDEIRAVLQNSAEDHGDPGRDKSYGYGIVDADAAVKLALGGNQSPVADAGEDQTVADTDGLAGETVSLDGSGSSDTDGTIERYVWSWSGGSAEGVNPTVALPDNTTFITLTVTDNEGATGSDEVAVNVTAPAQNQPPSAAFTFIVNDRSVQFTDESSDDEALTSWSWNFGDGATAVQQHPLHDYTEYGTYTVELTVTDSEGLQDSATQEVTLTDPSAPACLLRKAPCQDDDECCSNRCFRGACK